MKVLITGASGFIGAHVVELARARGLEIITPSRSELDLFGNDVRERVMELGATHLLHLAWYAEPGKFWDAEENFRWVAATLALVEGFANGGGQRLVGAGTCAEYDWHFGICNEHATPCEPATTYGVAKDATRRLVDAFTKAFAKKRSISAAWGRIFSPYGPREHPDRLVPLVIGALLKGEKASVTEGTQARDYLHVRDVADAFLTLLMSDATGPVNIASGEAVTVRDVVRCIAEQLQAEDRVEYGTVAMRENEPQLLVADATRLRNELQWTQQFDLISGIKDTIEWWKKELKCD